MFFKVERPRTVNTANCDKCHVTHGTCHCHCAMHARCNTWHLSLSLCDACKMQHMALATGFETRAS